RIRDARKRRAELVERLGIAMRRRLGASRDRVASLERPLAAGSPYGVLGRGYAIVRAGPRGVRGPGDGGPGGPLADPAAPGGGDVAPGDRLAIRLAGGELAAVVTSE